MVDIIYVNRRILFRPPMAIVTGTIFFQQGGQEQPFPAGGLGAL